MNPAGCHWIDGRPSAGDGEPFTAFDPGSGKALGPTYRAAGPKLVADATAAAAAAALPFGASSRAARSALLRALADGLLGLGDDLILQVMAETALPRPRVEAERGRTIGQLQQFAALLDDGSWVDARIDRADPARQPQPKPDVRSMRVALGPVAVFGASNFPLAYSVLGGDTASALAAGCPVVVKGHPAHPGTCERIAAMTAAVVAAQGLPAGVFGLVHGLQATGAALVQAPAIAAVGFTGSVAAGRALCDLAAARVRPIPVFAEMGSLNPVLVLPGALQRRAAGIGAQLAASALLAQGQFCTSPGLLAYVDGPGADAFIEALRQAFGAAVGGPLVHPSIRGNFERATGEALAAKAGALVRGSQGAAATAACPTLLAARADIVLGAPRLRHEIYGPATLLVACRDRGELLALVQALDGHLTGTVHGDGDDFTAFADVIAALRQRVGRLIGNGVPTGVEVVPSMVHGGPWPAASDARFTAVGTASILRWVRPACWQDWPAALLPPELQDDNPARIARLVDGVFVPAPR